MAFTLRVLLTAWFAIVLTGNVVSHRHVAPAGHTHGFGWATITSNCPHEGSNLPHRHIVLFGIEFGAVPLDDDEAYCEGSHALSGSIATAGEERSETIAAGLPTVEAVLASFTPGQVIESPHDRSHHIQNISKSLSKPRSAVLRL